MDHAGLSRVVQGVATGIGFLGGGVILKLASERKIEGLTTAADIWATAAIGVAIGLGALGIGLIATAFAWIVLGVLYRVEVRRRNSN
jgi:putative Mg2+ transporter-C (MgtC) family protein